METNRSEHNEGAGAAAWLVIIILAMLVAALYGCGCATSDATRANHYPVPVMLDPVTEEAPDVHIR